MDFYLRIKIDYLNANITVIFIENPFRTDRRNKRQFHDAFFCRFVVTEFVKTCDEHVPCRRLKGVDAGLAIVKAGAATVSVVIKQSAHHASVTTFRGQMQGCQAGMRLSVNCGAWNRIKKKKKWSKNS